MVLGDQRDLLAVLKWARWFGEQRDIADNFAAAHSDDEDDTAPEGTAFFRKLLKVVVAAVRRLLRAFIVMETGPDTCLHPGAEGAVRDAKVARTY